MSSVSSSRGMTACSSAAARSPWRATFARSRGPVDREDRRPPRPLAGDDQGLLLRPDWGEGACREGAIRRGVPRLRPAAQRKGRRVCVGQALPPLARSSAAGCASVLLAPMRECRAGCASVLLAPMRECRSATSDCRLPMTGRARASASAGERPSSGWPWKIGRLRASLRRCSGHGPPAHRRYVIRRRPQRNRRDAFELGYAAHAVDPFAPFGGCPSSPCTTPGSTAARSTSVPAAVVRRSTAVFVNPVTAQVQQDDGRSDEGGPAWAGPPTRSTRSQIRFRHPQLRTRSSGRPGCGA